MRHPSLPAAVAGTGPSRPSQRPASTRGLRRLARTLGVLGLLAGLVGGVVVAPVVSAAPASADDQTSVTAPASVEVTGDLRVGGTLTAQEGTWQPDGVTFAYTWKADGVPVEGATGRELVLTSAELEQTVSVEVTGSLEGLDPATVTGTATGPVGLGAIEAQPAPVVSGTAQVGSPLTAGTPGWSPDLEVGLQWLADGVPVPGATGATFTPEAGQLGRHLAVQATGTRDGYAPAQGTSTPTDAVAAGEFTAAPTPTVSGTPRVGAPLTAVAGGWAPSAELHYAWAADGVALPGATSSTFTPQAPQRGRRITVTVHADRAGYGAASRTSAPTAVVGAGLLTAPTPGIAGPVRVGSTLVVAPGTWSPGATLAYQWRVDGTAIARATNRWFTPQATERGRRITVTVTGRRDGYATTAVTSAPSPVVAAGVFSTAPVPAVKGYPQVGWTLTAVPGTWAPWGSLTYQWRVDGVAVRGATRSTYTPAPGDRGRRITVTVTARRPAYADTARTSAPTLAVTTPFTRAGTPGVTGTPRVWATLRATPGSWSPAPTFSYQWRRNGVAIAGATAATYRLVEADHGRRITVSVTARRGGSTPAARTSPPTAAVAGPGPTLTRDGTFRIGVSLGSGTFTAPGGSGCYWERRNRLGNGVDGVIANAYTNGGRQVVTLAPTDAWFVTDGCGPWTRMARVGTPATSFGNGTHRVGWTIAPGLYTTTGGQGCYWATLTGFGGTIAEIRENSFGTWGRRYVQVSSPLAGIVSSGCGTWTRVTG